MEITDKTISTLFKAFVLFAAIFSICVGPWGSDAFDALFGQEIKTTIQYISGTAAFITLILYLSAKAKIKRSLLKSGNTYYTESASKYIKAESVTPNTAELAIKNGTLIKRNNSLKYTRTDPEGIKHIILTDKNGVVSEVAR